MNNAIEIRGLKKQYPKSEFQLNLPALDVKEGFITGFIGENGAGKTTTLKLIMDMLYADEGTVSVFGLDSHTQGSEIRSQIGYVGDASGYLVQSKLKDLKKMVSGFFKTWDEAVFQTYIDRFSLDLNKQYKALSKGQKKQFDLSVALSHHPRLLLMDEPTANLDPLIRQDFLDVLSEEMQNEGVSIFFSTHITSDLDKIADYLIFLHGGSLILEGDKETLTNNHRIVKARMELLDNAVASHLIGVNKSDFGFTGLADDYEEIYELLGDEALYEKPTIEDLFIAHTTAQRGAK